MHNPTATTVRNTSSDAINRQISRNSDPIIRYLHLKNIALVPPPTAELVTMLGYIDQPFTIRRFFAFGAVSALARFFTDILISEDNRTDLEATRRDARLSYTYTPAGGFFTHQKTRPVALAYHVATGKRWLKSHIFATLNVNQPVTTSLWVELH